MSQKTPYETLTSEVFDVSELICAYDDLYGYTRESVTSAIKRLRSQDFSNEDVKNSMLKRADELEQKLDLITNHIENKNY
jgi:hypothetical protein